MAIGDTITAARYNNVHSRIASVMGTGSGTSGYGQALASSPVSVSDLATESSMDALYSDIQAASNHQTGSDNTSIVEIDNQDIIADEVGTGINGAQKGFADYENVMPTIEGDALLVSPGQATAQNVLSSIRSTQWNGTISHEFSLTFTSGDHRRHFFNAGGEMRFLASITGGSGAKTANWAGMLSTMTTVRFNYNETSTSGSGDGSNIGNYDLTESYQTVFVKTGSGVYSDNDYTVQARANTTSQLQFRVTFNDDNTGNPDENVNGTITSEIDEFRATGTNVSVPAPSYITISSLS